MVKLFCCTSCRRNDESQEPSVQPLYPSYLREKYSLCPPQGKHIDRTHQPRKIWIRSCISPIRYGDEGGDGLWWSVCRGGFTNRHVRGRVIDTYVRQKPRWGRLPILIKARTYCRIITTSGGRLQSDVHYNIYCSDHCCDISHDTRECNGRCQITITRNLITMIQRDLCTRDAAAYNHTNIFIQ